MYKKYLNSIIPWFLVLLFYSLFYSSIEWSIRILASPDALGMGPFVLVFLIVPSLSIVIFITATIIVIRSAIKRTIRNNYSWLFSLIVMIIIGAYMIGATIANSYSLSEVRAQTDDLSFEERKELAEDVYDALIKFRDDKGYFPETGSWNSPTIEEQLIPEYYTPPFYKDPLPFVPVYHDLLYEFPLYYDEKGIHVFGEDHTSDEDDIYIPLPIEGRTAEPSILYNGEDIASGDNLEVKYGGELSIEWSSGGEYCIADPMDMDVNIKGGGTWNTLGEIENKGELVLVFNHEDMKRIYEQENNPEITYKVPGYEEYDISIYLNIQCKDKLSSALKESGHWISVLLRE